MIDKILCLTLNKSQTRRDIYIGRMTAQGVPLESIHFVRGKASSDFRKDYTAIADAAERDGFPFVRYFQNHDDTGMVKQTPAQMAQVWSYAQILRHIASGDETCLVTWDDRYLNTPFEFLEVIIEQLKEGYDFHLFQLRLRGSPEYLRLPPLTFWEEAHVHQQLFGAFTDLKQQLDHASIFTKPGFYGYDETIIFTPAGAKWMLEEMYSIEPLHGIDLDLYQLKYDEVPHHLKPQYCATLNIDNWICWGLRDAADKASEEGKLHRPRYYGFDFIIDAIPQGSLTGWASEESDYPEMDKHFEYNFIDL